MNQSPFDQMDHAVSVALGLKDLDDLRRIVHPLTGKGVRIEFVKEHLSFTGEDSPMANLLLSVMGAFAEFERALVRERQREGISLAKQRGVYTGRKPALTTEQAQQLRERAAAGEKKSALAREFGISRETVYSYLRRRRHQRHQLRHRDLHPVVAQYHRERRGGAPATVHPCAAHRGQAARRSRASVA